MSNSSSQSRVWLEINLKTLSDNFKKIRNQVKPAKVISVLKANAYGLGSKRLAGALSEAGSWGFAVAELKEAMDLVDIGKPVMILGSLLKSDIPDVVNHDIIVPIADLETARAVSAEAVKQSKTAECHFLIDTGMGRLGCLWSDACDLIRETVKLPNLNCAGIYSHFPVAYRTGSHVTENQVKRFYDILETMKQEEISFQKIHIANSDAINNFPYTYQYPFNFVRTGINLHGSFDDEGQRSLNLQSILTLKTKLVAVRKLKAGMTIGYGCTYRLVKDTLVGTIAAGYADGLPLALSNRGYVLINNTLCPILGKVSMDYTTISLENIPDAIPGDDVTCLGGEGLNAITVDYWSQLKGTNTYDIICSFGSRVERRYIT